ncbi:Hypothetical predicted protein [Paramuricea clavata]|uniref:Uncharacterized protein n=1 Tax=Paramuricea clavata TaxID=317549 RepID=A0A6S7HCK6_PARCT|nr:Hypothetical predicted protein [Paramuricea clavata]
MASRFNNRLSDGKFGKVSQINTSHTKERLLKAINSWRKTARVEDTYGVPDPNGKCVLVSIDSIGNLVTYFQNTIPVRSVTPFEIKGVTVELMAFESAEQTDTSGQKANTNRASYKRRQTTESESHKQAWLENARIYKKRKQPEKEVRNLQNQGDYLERFDITNGGIHEQAWAKSV